MNVGCTAQRDASLGGPKRPPLVLDILGAPDPNSYVPLMLRTADTVRAYTQKWTGNTRGVHRLGVHRFGGTSRGYIAGTTKGGLGGSVRVKNIGGVYSGTRGTEVVLVPPWFVANRDEVVLP